MSVPLVFILTTILIFLAIFIEAAFLYSQWKTQWLTRKFGDKAFKIHSAITETLWTVASVGMIITLFAPNPHFHTSTIASVIGWILFGGGMVVATLGFKELGLERSLGINFFEEDVEIVESGIYKYISEPEEYGFWVMMAGFALGTASWYVLIYAIEFVVLMIPHQKIENLPLKEGKSTTENEKE